MTWNWQQPDWPDFAWDQTRLAKAEERYLLEAGECRGVLKHLGAVERDQLAADAMSEEAVTTSAIEGEILERASVQSSIRRQLGLAADTRRVTAAEQGVAGTTAMAASPAPSRRRRWRKISAIRRSRHWRRPFSPSARPTTTSWRPTTNQARSRPGSRGLPRRPSKPSDAPSR